MPSYWDIGGGVGWLWQVQERELGLFAARYLLAR